MSLKEDLDRYMGSMLHHLDTVTIDKDAQVHGESATKITAMRSKGNDQHFMEAFYLDRNKMTTGSIAYDFSNKVDKWLKGTLEEL